MIKSFGCKKTEALFRRGKCDKAWQSFDRVARRKLLMLDGAKVLPDLKAPPGNQLEALKGDRIGQHAIRVNDRYRLCFVWDDDGATSVEIVDYH
jgi:proteic killer suppression protein